MVRGAGSGVVGGILPPEVKLVDDLGLMSLMRFGYRM